MINTIFFFICFLLSATFTWAQELLPTEKDIAKAQEMAREALQFGAVMPDVASMPKPAAPAPDLATIAEHYREMGQAVAGIRSGPPELLVLVSFSMPQEALHRLVDQAEKAGATLVFRGLKDDSMMKMGQEIQRLLGGRNVSVAIHPPAFQQYGVRQVPAVVIARPEAGNMIDNGCAQPQTYIKVSGDVSLDYALEYIERNSHTWASVARHYRNKIVRGID